MSDIKYVVNFDFPNNTEDYVHRIGRTARAENTGTAYTYFTTQNAKQARELMNVLKEAKQNINPKLYEMMAIAKQMYQSKSEFVCGAIQAALICLLQCFQLLSHVGIDSVPTYLSKQLPWNTVLCRKCTRQPSLSKFLTYYLQFTTYVAFKY